MLQIKELARIRRHKRIRSKVVGMAGRPRLSLHRSLQNLYIQIIDDNQNKTLLSVSTLDKEIKQKVSYGGNVKAAVLLGEICSRRAKEKGIKSIVFDRGGYLYHGRIKAFAEAARKGGLEF